MVNQIATSTASTATAYSNQRKIDRCSNGVLWMIHQSTPALIQARYSLDNGATWVLDSGVSPGTGAETYVMSSSFFIDQDDYAHVAYRNNSDGYIYYRRGTPNAGCTAWTWSAATLVTSTSLDYPDVVAHREGSGWAVHVVLTTASGTSSTSKVRYARLSIASDGTTTITQAVIGIGSVSTANTNPAYPSIDFNHTGDGKTVAGGTPHLYMAWSAGATGAGYGIRFKKATYSAGTWTWGTTQEIDSGQYTPSLYWMNCMFDGTRVVIAGHVDGTVAGALAIYERDAADTTTTVRLRTAQAAADRYFNGSATYDSAGNIYFTGQSVYSNSGKASLRTVKWDRNAGTVGTPSAIDTNVPDAATAPVHAILKRGYSNSRLEFIYTDGTVSPYSVKYSYVGDPNPELYPASITTSTSATATAYSNQRKVDRCQNGVLWAFFVKPDDSNQSLYPRYSTDSGVTWTIANVAGTGNEIPSNLSVFIDLDDYCHVVWKQNVTVGGLTSGCIYYMRGTPNAARTSWTWSATTTVWGSTGNGVDFPDLVAHREGTGWVAHVVLSRTDTADGAFYKKLSIASNGVVTVGSDVYIGGISPAYGNSVAKYPSIDFNHTGDGKTIKDGTPHLYAAWSAGATGAGKGIRFKKATYSGGTWTWGTEREIDSTRMWSSVSNFLLCMYDGTRVTIAARLWASASTNDIMIYERDANDTITTVRPLEVPEVVANAVAYGSASYDSLGNIYFVGANYDEAAGSYDLVYRKWTRATLTYETEIIVDSTVGALYVSAKRGYSNNRIEYIYTDGNASPYTITFGMVQLNRTPTVVNPTPAGAVGKGDNLTVNWTYSDLDSDPQSKYQIRWRKIL